jgi:hypothetical protein
MIYLLRLGQMKPQKSYLCIKAKKCIFFVRVCVFWPKRSRGLQTGEDKRHFLAEVHIMIDVPTLRRSFENMKRREQHYVWKLKADISNIYSSS